MYIAQKSERMMKNLRKIFNIFLHLYAIKIHIYIYTYIKYHILKSIPSLQITILYVYNKFYFYLQ